MRKIAFIVSGLAICSLLNAQTLNVEVGNVHYLFPAEQTGKMPYDNGTTLTVMGKIFTLSEITNMYVDETPVTDNAVSVFFDGNASAITVAGNVAKDLVITSSGAHVSIVQSENLEKEIIYTLSGSSDDGGFYTSGAYKATLALNNLTLTNASAVYAGAAIHVDNSKRIKIQVAEGTTNTLVDAAGNKKQKGCLYIKGHAEFVQKGTLNVTGNYKHAIKCGEYFSIKNATINILSAAGDGINCEQFFLMKSGTINISGVADDGIQCDIEDTTIGSTGETTDHEEEDSGNVYLEGGILNINVTADAAKGLKAEGSIAISGGDITIATSGNGVWDETAQETKSASCINSDYHINISGGTINLTSSGSGGKGIKCDSVLTISGSPVINIATTGGLCYYTGSSLNHNASINTDEIDSKYYSSPKGIRAGTKTLVSGSGLNAVYTYAGGLYIHGGKIKVTTQGSNGEGIESKNDLIIDGGEIFVDAKDDGINAALDLTISGGYVYSRGQANDGIDANGNVYIQGGFVYAVGTKGAEKSIDAKEGKKLYVSGGTLIALGDLESGASLTQTCYSASSWQKNKWYSFTVGNEVYAFYTPEAGGTKLIVSAASQPTVKSNVTVSDGTPILDGVVLISPTCSGGSSVDLSTYTPSGGGPGGGRYGGQGW